MLEGRRLDRKAPAGSTALAEPQVDAGLLHGFLLALMIDNGDCGNGRASDQRDDPYGEPRLLQSSPYFLAGRVANRNERLAASASRAVAQLSSRVADLKPAFFTAFRALCTAAELV